MISFVTSVEKDRRSANEMTICCFQVVECVLQVLKTKKSPLLCVCAPSNYAADILCRCKKTFQDFEVL